MTVRAAVVVTGTEVLTGRVSDRNGPWLAQRLQEQGVEVRRIVVVGDDSAELASLLRGVCADHDLVVTTGGLGPTADDLTAAVVGEVQGRPSRLDEDLEERIRVIVEDLLRRRRWRSDPVAVAAGTRKQAMVPEGAYVLEPVGTAPGLVVPPAPGRSGAPVIVLPGPPAELRAMWPAALASPLVRDLLAGLEAPLEDTIRLWGTLEADLAASLRRVEPRIRDLEVSTCMRDGEIEIVTRCAPAAVEQLSLLRDHVLRDFAPTAFGPHGETVDELVAARLLERRWMVATAESCSGGLIGARLTDPPGASAYVVGSVLAYADEVKSGVLDVPAELIAEHGAVSAPVALALAEGARRALGAQVGIGVTGIAGPAGGSPDKPVGTVHLAVITPDAQRERRLSLPGDREQIRRRTVTTALHELRLALA